MATKVNSPKLEQLQTIFKHKATGFEDLTISPEHLKSFLKDGNDKCYYKMLRKSEAQEIAFAHSALTQILTRLRVPTHFYRKNPGFIQNEIFNYWKQTHRNKGNFKDFLFRFDHTTTKNHIRAVLSDKYGIIDDLDLFDIIFEVLKERTDTSYRLLEYDDHVTQLYVDFRDCQGEYEGTIWTAGVVITNSETGHSAVWVEPVVHDTRYSWFNRHVLRAQGVDCRIIHRGKLVRGRLPDMVEKAKEIAQIGITQLAEQFQVRISSAAAISMAKSIEVLPSRFIQILEEEWSKEEDIAKAEAAGRILSLAQDLPLFQKIQIQQDAGKFLGLFKGYRDRFTSLAQEITDEQDRAHDAS